jgi:hypothetical protein
MSRILAAYGRPDHGLPKEAAARAAAGIACCAGLKRTSRLRPRDLAPLDQSSGAGRFFTKMIKEIENDLGAGSRRNLSRIETELIRAFASAATQLQYLNHQILLGEGSEIDLAGFSQLASTMLRIGSRIGTERRLKQTLDLDTFLALRRRSRGESPEGEVE